MELLFCLENAFIAELLQVSGTTDRLSRTNAATAQGSRAALPSLVLHSSVWTQTMTLRGLTLLYQAGLYAVIPCSSLRYRPIDYLYSIKQRN